MVKNGKPVVLVVIDGWGLAAPTAGNAITLASGENFKKLRESFAYGQLTASGTAVGLPENQAGNSEVGHLNLGAGTIVYQDLPRINRAISDGSFWENPAFRLAFEHIFKFNSSIHLMGLVGTGGVHSWLDHLFALLWYCRQYDLPADRVKLHLFTDGRDSSPKLAKSLISDIEARISKIGIGQIATVIGRYYAMDRDNHWERTQGAYEAMVLGVGNSANSAAQAIEAAYEAQVTDEFIPPTVITATSGIPVGQISNGDSVIFFNFRPDRTRQLTMAFTLEDFETVEVPAIAYTSHLDDYGILVGEVEKKLVKTFPRKVKLKNLCFVTMTQYDKNLAVSAVAFEPKEISLSLAKVISEYGLTQFHIAETEKYPHVTYFFNGGQETAYPGEERVLIPSPKVPTYDLAPEMSAFKITDVLLKELKEELFDFTIVNFANPDMVGHTGNLPATITAVETVDECLGKIEKFIMGVGGTLIITGDHGNAEEMINLETGEIDTEHTTNPVPLIIASSALFGKNLTLPTGILADVAPTILDILGLVKPAQMTGKSLIANQ